MILGDNVGTRELIDEYDSNVYFPEMGSGEKLAKKILQIKSNN